VETLNIFTQRGNGRTSHHRYETGQPHVIASGTLGGTRSGITLSDSAHRLNTVVRACRTPVEWTRHSRGRWAVQPVARAWTGDFGPAARRS